MVAWAGSASLVRMEIHEFDHLAHGVLVAATGDFAISQAHRSRETILRSYVRAALDDVDFVFRFDRGAGRRNATR